MAGKGNPDIVKAGEATQFGKGQDPTKGGRKKNIYKVLKETGYSKDDIRTAFAEMPMHTLKDLQAIYKNDDSPALARVVAKAMHDAVKSGKISGIKEILEYAIGKPSNSKDLPPTPEESRATYKLPDGTELDI